MQPTRYAYLDGIRGLAAMFVMFRHSEALLGIGTYRSYLAVDLFFLLSGFVIAHAYEGRLRSGALGFADFVRVRLIRLYPVYFMSAVLALGVAVLAFGATGKLDSGTAVQMALAGCMMLLFLPFQVSWSTALFPLNSVYWSLFFELIVNILYALVHRHLSDRVLQVVVAVSAIVCAALALTTGTLDQGYGFALQHLAGGLARSLFGFSVGVLFYRHRTALAALVRGRVGPVTSFVLVSAMLASPSVPGWDGALDLLCVFVVIPLAVAGAAFESPRHAMAEHLMETLGSASYPLYVLHMPLVYLAYQVAKRLGSNLTIPFAIAVVIGLVLLAVQIERRIDIPVRRWFTERRRARGAAAKASASL